MQDADLRQIERDAIEIARTAGAMLLGYFRGPLEVTYKSENRRNPVTNADHAVDAYVRAEIARRYPAHAIVTEEHADTAATAPSDVVWVVDPLDGTSNFLNGVPMFGVLIGVLERGKPVAGAIFVPDIARPEGRVLHARADGGAYDEDTRLTLATATSTAAADDARRAIGALPSFGLRMFAFQPKVRRSLGDIRTTGCVAYEFVLMARGALHYAVFSGPRAWDVAAGIVVLQEAAGAVLAYRARGARWEPFAGFVGRNGTALTPAQLRQWQGLLVAGTPKAAAFVAHGMRPRSFWWRRTLRWLRARLFRRRPARQPQPATAGASPDGQSQAAAPPVAPAERPDARPQSQGQGTSRRE